MKCSSSKDLFKLIRKWKAIKIKDLPTFKKFYQAYQRIAGWLHIQKKISDDDFKLWFWAGLHQAFQRKVEARMWIDDQHLDDTKAFKISKIVDAVQKLFTRKCFENRIQIIMKKLAEDSDELDLDSSLESESSDHNSEEKSGSDEEELDNEDRIGALATQLRKMKKKINHVHFRKPAKLLELVKHSNGDSPIDEIVKKMKGLSLEDKEYKKLYNKAM